MADQPVSLWVMAMLYIAAGINHFVMPKMYQKIIPPFLPFPGWINRITGALEIILGALILVPVLTRPAAWGIIVLLILIYPANIYHFIKGWQKRKMVWVLAMRLPLQLLLIWWAYIYTH